MVEIPSKGRFKRSTNCSGRGSTTIEIPCMLNFSILIYAPHCIFRALGDSARIIHLSSRTSPFSLSRLWHASARREAPSHITKSTHMAFSLAEQSSNDAQQEKEEVSHSRTRFILTQLVSSSTTTAHSIVFNCLVLLDECSAGIY